LALGGALLQQASGEGEDNRPTERMGGDGRRPPSTDSRGWRSSPQSSSPVAAGRSVPGDGGWADTGCEMWRLGACATG
jgi:hypothetical protein